MTEEYVVSADYHYTPRLNTPGFTPSTDQCLIGHDDTRLFLYGDGTLASVRKP